MLHCKKGFLQRDKINCRMRNYHNYTALIYTCSSILTNSCISPLPTISELVALSGGGED